MLKFFSSLSNSRKLSQIQLTLLIILIIGLTGITSYGMSWDEPLEIYISDQNYHLVTKGKALTSMKVPDPPFSVKDPDRYYGIGFSAPTELVYQAVKKLGIFKLSQKTDALLNQDPEVNDLRERIRVKHILTFWISLVAYFCSAKMLEILMGQQFAWLGCLIPIMFPRFWGHSFFNPKDIPFAAIFTACTYCGGVYIAKCLNPDSDRRSLIASSLTLGALIGWLAGIRPGGIIYLLFIPLGWVIVALTANNFVISLGRFIKTYALVASASLSIAILCYPSAWIDYDLKTWIPEVIKIVTNSPFYYQVLFEGKSIFADQLPKRYLVEMFAVTTPIVSLIAFIAGLFFLINKFKQLSNLQKSIFVLLVLQIFLLPFTAFVRHATLYDGIRHFLFVLPAAGVIALCPIVALCKKLNDNQHILSINLGENSLVKTNIIVVGFTLMLLPIILTISRLHPYEYVYFNSLVGGISGGSKLYETDYLTISLKAAIEEVNILNQENYPTIIAGPWDGARIYARKEIPTYAFDGNSKSYANFQKQFITLRQNGGHTTINSLIARLLIV